MSLTISILLSTLAIAIALFLLGFTIIKENETGAVVRLGKPARVIKSGLKWIFWPLEKVILFPTSLIQLEFRLAGIITEQGEYNGTKYGQANIGIEPALYFRWPENNNLLETVKIVATPENISSLNDLFEETILNAFRSAGGAVTWREIVKDRKEFSAKVLEALINDASDPINQARIPRENINLVIKHVNLPEELEEAITKPEIARMEKEATITKAEGEKKRLILEGEGFARARKELFKAIGDSPESMRKEVLYTLREMAKGTSNTILFGIPSEITDSLGNIFNEGGDFLKNFKKFFSGLDQSKQKEFLAWFEKIK
jgi:regulator of protease activity HflC (stomatin/prohibitin superfamily)